MFVQRQHQSAKTGDDDHTNGIDRSSRVESSSVRVRQTVYQFLNPRCVGIVKQTNRITLWNFNFCLLNYRPQCNL